MKHKLIAALIIAMLLLIAAGSIALAYNAKCDTCNEWRDFTPGEWKVDVNNRLLYHRQVYSCVVCGHEILGSPEEHTGGKASCSASAVCTMCGAEYGEKDPNNHDLTHHEAKAATCTDIGWNAYETCKNCNYSTYQEIPALNHDLVYHEAKAATCTDIGWEAYETCKNCNYSTYQEIPALNHDLVYHEAKTPTCTEIGWNEYDTCTRCKYTTYQEIPALNHDLVHHDAKTPTCTEIGWNEYNTCTRCDYTTYAEIPASGHDLKHHKARAATCTQKGWKAYDACMNCSYSTYAEIPALGHDYRKIIVEPTCEENGYTQYICSRGDAVYTWNPVQKLYHWFGEWASNADGSHSANCLRKGCKHTGKTGCQNFQFQVEENASLIFCPVCGQAENGQRLERIEKARVAAVTGKLPAGEVIARMNGEYLSLAFELSGRVTQPTGQVKITLPVEVLAGRSLSLIA